VKLNLSDDLGRFFGNHRSGWSYALECLRPLHDPKGVRVVSFVEKKFIFGTEAGEAMNSFVNVSEPWIGFVHCPVHVPAWFNGTYSPKLLFQDKNFQDALRNCVGLFSLSTPLGNWLKKNFDGNVDIVLHPTESGALPFNLPSYRSSRKKRVVQLGFWLRRLHAIWELDLPAKQYAKCVVGVNQPWQKDKLRLERRVLGLSHQDEDVYWFNLLSNREYDRLLSESIVFVDFYDTSANNAIVECIARAVPVICPPNRAIVDYLGEDYPLYFRDYHHATELCQDLAAISRAHDYLKDVEVRDRVSALRFVESVGESCVVKVIG